MASRRSGGFAAGARPPRPALSLFLRRLLVMAKPISPHCPASMRCTGRASDATSWRQSLAGSRVGIGWTARRYPGAAPAAAHAMSPESALTRRWTHTAAGLIHARVSGDLSRVLEAETDSLATCRLTRGIRRAQPNRRPSWSPCGNRDFGGAGATLRRRPEARRHGDSCHVAVRRRGPVL